MTLTAPNALPPAATLSYTQLRDGLLLRRYQTDAPSAGAAELAATLLPDAYRQCLAAGLWPEPAHGCTVAVTAGRVDRAFFHAARAVEFWTADPAADPAATLVDVLEMLPDAFVLDTSAATVWARQTLIPVCTEAAVVSTTTYVAGDVVLATGGDVFVCLSSTALGSALADPAKWAPVRYLALLAAPAQVLALADWWDPTQADYATRLRADATQRLARLATIV